MRHLASSVVLVVAAATTGAALVLPQAAAHGTAAVAHLAPRHRVAASPIMGQWLKSDMSSASLPLPDEIEAMLSEDTPRPLTEIMWAAFRSCYPDDDAAIAAAERNTGVILPYLNRPSNIYGSFEVLKETFGDEGAAEVVRKNPGILTCDPRALAGAEPDQIRQAANFVDFVESLGVPLVVRNNLDKITVLVLGGLVYKRIAIDCAGASCGF